MISFLLKLCTVFSDSLIQQDTIKESRWVERIAAGDRRAEQELLVYFEDQIDRLVKTKIGSRNDDVDDLKQDVRVALVKSLREGKFDTAKGRIGSYVYGVTSNKIKDYLKSPRRLQPVELEYDLPDSYDLQEELERKERVSALRKALEELPKKYKIVLYQRYFLDRSITEISQDMNLPTRRVSERINYAKKLLRNVFPV